MIDVVIQAVRGAWRLLPREFPVGRTVYDYFQHWRNCGGWEQMHTALREEARRQSGRAAEPWAAIIDAQSVKTTDRGGEQGDEVGKKINGRKRQLLVDTLGLVFKAKVHAANIADRGGAHLLLEPLPRGDPARFLF